MATPAVFVTSVFCRHTLNHPICYTCDLEHEKRIVNSYTLSNCHIWALWRGWEIQTGEGNTESWLVDGEQCPQFSCSSGRLLVGTHLLMATAMLWWALGLYHWRVWILRSKPATWNFRQIAESCDDKDVKYIIYQWHCLHCSLQDCQIWSLIEIEWKAHIDW